MTPEHLARLKDDQLHTMHRNCLLKLDDPVLSADAAALLPILHSEFARRAAKETRGEFLPMLRCVGYNVQWQGLGFNERRKLLNWIVDGDLPFINDASYMDVWGPPRSFARFKAVIDNIETYRRRFGNGLGMENAVARWRVDLAYLNEMATRVLSVQDYSQQRIPFSEGN